MSDTVQAWVEERRDIHAAASEGPWSWRECPPCKEGGREDIQVWSGDENEVVTQWMEAIKDTPVADDATAIVDAHNMFPRALNALEQVLGLHVKETGGTPDGGIADVCSCGVSYWPCATVQTIEGAINNE